MSDPRPLWQQYYDSYSDRTEFSEPGSVEDLRLKYACQQLSFWRKLAEDREAELAKALEFGLTVGRKYQQAQKGNIGGKVLMGLDANQLVSVKDLIDLLEL